MTNKIILLPECLNSVQEEVLSPPEAKIQRTGWNFPVFSGASGWKCARDVLWYSYFTSDSKSVLKLPWQLLAFLSESYHRDRWFSHIYTPNQVNDTAAPALVFRVACCQKFQAQERKDRDVSTSHLHLQKQVKKKSPSCAQLQLQRT